MWGRLRLAEAGVAPASAPGGALPAGSVNRPSRFAKRETLLLSCTMGHLGAAVALFGVDPASMRTRVQGGLCVTGDSSPLWSPARPTAAPPGTVGEEVRNRTAGLMTLT